MYIPELLQKFHMAIIPSIEKYRIRKKFQNDNDILNSKFRIRTKFEMAMVFLIKTTEFGQNVKMFPS